MNVVDSDLCWVVFVGLWIFEWQWFASCQCAANSLALLSTTKVKKLLVSCAAFTCSPDGPISWVGKSIFRLWCVHVHHVGMRGAAWTPKISFIALYHSTIYSYILNWTYFIPSITVEFFFLIICLKGRLRKLHRMTKAIHISQNIEEVTPTVQYTSQHYSKIYSHSACQSYIANESFLLA